MLSNVRAIEEFHCFTVISSQILKITLQKERWCRLRERNTVKDVKYARTFFFFFFCKDLNLYSIKIIWQDVFIL